MQQPELKGNTRRQVQEAMRGILGYRTYFDLRRGWRFNNPNLEQLGLVRINYQDLEDLAADASEWAEAPQVLQVAKPAERAKVLRELFDFMRQGLCIATRYLDRTELDQLRTQSYANLREPWGFTEDERPVPPAGSSPAVPRKKPTVRVVGVSWKTSSSSAPAAPASGESCARAAPGVAATRTTRPSTTKPGRTWSGRS
jgi:hypothetical protein